MGWCCRSAACPGALFVLGWRWWPLWCAGAGACGLSGLPRALSPPPSPHAECALLPVPLPQPRCWETCTARFLFFGIAVPFRRASLTTRFSSFFSSAAPVLLVCAKSVFARCYAAGWRFDDTRRHCRESLNRGPRSIYLWVRRAVGEILHVVRLHRAPVGVEIHVAKRHVVCHIRSFAGRALLPRCWPRQHFISFGGFRCQGCHRASPGPFLPHPG